MDNILEVLLDQQKISYAIFDQNLELIQHSPNFIYSVELENLEIGLLLTDLFPEFFSFEKEIMNLLKTEKQSFKIEMVNKIDEDGNIIYFDYIFTSLNSNKLLLSVSDSSEYSSLKQKILQQQNEIKILKESISSINADSYEKILGTSDVIISVKKFIKKVADLYGTTILLTGESGTGKTLVARAIHNASKNFSSPFVELNCATIPSTLLESELFGHVKGAFTSAVENKKGLLEEANGGTIFLDEIGELPLSVQPKFLSFLESKRFRRVGSTKELTVNCRIITATNKDLKSAVSQKEFREDLYYRINVISFNIPALRERDNDILIIAKHLVSIFNKEFNKCISGFTNKAEKKLLNYSWPGNIRELRNVIERAAIFCDCEKIDDFDIVINVTDPEEKNKPNILIPPDGISFENLEKEYIQQALIQTEGNQTKAAKLLNLSLDTLRYRIKKFNI